MMGFSFAERPLTPPEPETFYGYVSFACPVNEAEVEVTARVADDELIWDTVMVWYCGTEVSALIGVPGSEQIEAYFKKNLKQITEFADDDF